MNRRVLPLGIVLSAILASSCTKPESPPTPPNAGPTVLRDEIPPDQLNAVLADHYAGLGAMERYEYPAAIDAFRRVHQKAPGWIVGSINLAIALLNEGGEVAEASGNPEQAKTEGVSRNNMDEAVGLLDGVLAREPNNPTALYCKGIIREFQGQFREAHDLFGKVLAIDPTDAHAWLERGATLTNPTEPDLPAGTDQAAELIGFYSKALENNPYLVPAMFKLQAAYGWAGEADQRDRLMALWQRFNPKLNAAANGDPAAQVYGEMGKHARILNPFPRREAATPAAPAPRFAPPEALSVTLPDGVRWATLADFTGVHATLGRARTRFGPGMITLDANGDGRLDLYLPAAVVGPKGLRDVLLIRRTTGDVYDDATLAMGLPEDRAGLGVAAVDFDADRRIDLFVFGVGDQRLFRNVGARFEDVTGPARIDGRSAVAVGARWLDLDQDGDLDLYVINHAPASSAVDAFTVKPTPGITNAAYRNDGQPGPIPNRPADNFAPVAVATDDLPAKEGLSIAFSEAWPGVEALRGEAASYSAMASLDVDEDRDLDLVLAADGQPTRIIRNDRAGSFRADPADVVAPAQRIDGLLAVDLDKDGRVDLVATRGTARVSAWRNVAPASGQPRPTWAEWPIAAKGWVGATVADLDLDTNPDLVGCAADPAPGSAAWLRWTGDKLTSSPLALGPDAQPGAKVIGVGLANLAGDLLPDLILWSGESAPRVARNLGNGLNYVSIELSGRWKTSFDQMRTNPHGVGTRFALEGQGIYAPFDTASPSTGPSQTVGPIVLGLGSHLSAPLLRLRWPDGVMQCELNVTANKSLAVAEVSRKTGSCPVLFTWNGARFECLGDFLGGGGLGYLVAPGVYSQPDRDESVLIADHQLRPRSGRLCLSVVEPMDEVAYLDHLRLDVVDAPPGVDVVLDERFAPEEPRPSGATWPVTRRVDPVRVTDHRGNDLTEAMARWDRQTADRFRRLNGWVGYAEDHSVTLDFGDRLADFPADTPLVLCLTGWVEYPYSQTNYAAATAGVTLQPPTLERQGADGRWEIINPSMGYPAGLPRQMTVDLTGKVGGDRCVLRVRTNMECYWDQIDVRVRASTDPGLNVTSLDVVRAELGDKGYLREVSPDGRIPLIYDYDHPDPAPLARMAGMLTRHGDVVPLLRADDDQFCTVGPGDEVRLEFDATRLPALREGWTRRYVLRSFGYCKDADPYTAGSDTVEPLPWRGMPPFPFAPGTIRPAESTHDAFVRTWQTRPAGSR